MSVWARFQLSAILLLCAGAALPAEQPAPSAFFDLSGWKLQIPGPKEIKALKNYSSSYFFLNSASEMCFHLDASEKGATPNAHYVRSELRHLVEWKASETHRLSGEFRVVSKLSPDKVTALQIHGVTEAGENAPPLLRVAVNNGDLVAAIKVDNEGAKTDMIVLKKRLGAGPVKVDVAVQNQQLTIKVDGEPKLTRSLAFWKYRNYFKAGCYPQSTQGVADVFFRKLTAE